MRVILVVSSLHLRDELSCHFRNVEVMGAGNMPDLLDALRERENITIVCTARVASQGFRVPSDTLILTGPGIVGAELAQIQARVARLDEGETHATG